MMKTPARTMAVFVVSVVLLAAAGSVLAAMQVRYTTANTVALYNKPAGTIIGSIYVATPLVVSSTTGKWSQVQLFGWSRKGGGSIVYADVGSVGSSILAASITGAAPKPLLTKTNQTTGVTWMMVMLQGWVQTAGTQANRTALWKSVSTLYQATCSVCHAMHQPQEFTSQQWPGYLQPMFPKTSLTTVQQTLILHYLQWHAQDIPAKLQH